MNYWYNTLISDDDFINFDYPNYYYIRGNSIRNNVCNMNIDPFKDVYKFNNYNFDFTYIIDNKYSYMLLWFLNSRYVNNVSLLDNCSNIIKNINSVIRGGINTYKLNGWMVHVLYVYHLIEFNFKNNIVPTYFKDSDIDFSIYNKSYNRLSEKGKIILKVFALIHDVGVIDGVSNHDINGCKYVKSILSELKLDEIYFNKHNLKYEDSIKLLEILVGNHTLINKISGEECDYSIIDRCKDIIYRLDSVNVISFEEISIILYLLGVADLIAVDDSLLSFRKYNLVNDSFLYLDNLFKGNFIIRNNNNIVLCRIGEMIPEKYYFNLNNSINDYFNSMGYDYNLFSNSIINIYKFDYASAYLKMLDSLEDILYFLYNMFLFINNNNVNINKLEIIFDTNINIEYIKNCIRCGNIFSGNVTYCFKNDNQFIISTINK